MAYEITFTDSVEKTFKRMRTDERCYIQKKLNEIASSELRHPTQWDFKRLDGKADGRFRIGNGLRVFADIDDAKDTIRIHQVARRENLYS